MLARKAHISSEEARLQAEKAMEIEAQLERCKYEISRVRISHIKTKQIFFIRMKKKNNTMLDKSMNVNKSFQH